jgi:ATP-binding cassette, subfamily B, bacterial PglK
MNQYAQKFLYIISGKKKTFIGILFAFLFLSALETFGIGLIGPFIALAIDPKAIHRNVWIEKLYQDLDLSSEYFVIAALGVTIIMVLCIKAFLGFNIQSYIFKFGFGHQAEMRVRLMSSYLKVPYAFHLKQNTASLISSILTSIIYNL